jgi:septal ring factor EnvC (AmiA/AmiB activator)
MTNRLVFSMIALLLAMPVRAGLFEDEEARKALMDQQANLRSMQESIKKMDEELVQSKRSYLDLQSQNEVLLKQISELRGSLELLSKQLSDSQRA